MSTTLNHLGSTDTLPISWGSTHGQLLIFKWHFSSLMRECFTVTIAKQSEGYSTSDFEVILFHFPLMKIFIPMRILKWKNILTLLKYCCQSNWKLLMLFHIEQSRIWMEFFNASETLSMPLLKLWLSTQCADSQWNCRIGTSINNHSPFFSIKYSSDDNGRCDGALNSKNEPLLSSAC